MSVATKAPPRRSAGAGERSAGPGAARVKESAQATSVTLEEILAAAATRSASLVPETSGYLALAIGDATARLPFRVEDRRVTLTTEGTVTVARGHEGITADQAACELRDLLARLLAVSSGSMPGLASAARGRSEADWGIDGVIVEIEAALIPVNRAAARRALARLARETLRAKEMGRLKRRMPGAGRTALAGTPVAAAAAAAAPVAARAPAPTPVAAPVAAPAPVPAPAPAPAPVTASAPAPVSASASVTASVAAPVTAPVSAPAAGFTDSIVYESDPAAEDEIDVTMSATPAPVVAATAESWERCDAGLLEDSSSESESESAIEDVIESEPAIEPDATTLDVVTAFAEPDGPDDPFEPTPAVDATPTQACAAVESSPFDGDNVDFAPGITDSAPAAALEPGQAMPEPEQGAHDVDETTNDCTTCAIGISPLSVGTPIEDAPIHFESDVRTMPLRFEVRPEPAPVLADAVQEPAVVTVAAAAARPAPLESAPPVQATQSAHAPAPEKEPPIAAPVEQPAPAAPPIAAPPIAAPPIAAPPIAAPPIAAPPIAAPPIAAPRRAAAPSTARPGQADLGPSAVSSVDDLLARFSKASIGDERSDRTVRSSLKQLAQLDPTPSPPAARCRAPSSPGGKIDSIEQTAARRGRIAGSTADAPPMDEYLPTPRRPSRAGLTVSFLFLVVGIAGTLLIWRYRPDFFVGRGSAWAHPGEVRSPAETEKADPGAAPSEPGPEARTDR